jgi:hypothetical protein
MIAIATRPRHRQRWRVPAFWQRRIRETTARAGKESPMSSMVARRTRSDPTDNGKPLSLPVVEVLAKGGILPQPPSAESA